MHACMVEVICSIHISPGAYPAGRRWWRRKGSEIHAFRQKTTEASTPHFTLSANTHRSVNMHARTQCKGSMVEHGFVTIEMCSVGVLNDTSC